MKKSKLAAKTRVQGKLRNTSNLPRAIKHVDYLSLLGKTHNKGKRAGLIDLNTKEHF